MTEGIIVAMKALTVAMVVNNSSNEGQVMTEALGKERETLLAKVSQLGEDTVMAKKEFDDRVAKLSEQLEMLIRLWRKKLRPPRASRSSS